MPTAIRIKNSLLMPQYLHVALTRGLRTLARSTPGGFGVLEKEKRGGLWGLNVIANLSAALHRSCDTASQFPAIISAQLSW
jgi:hypothetical protein